MSRSTEAGGRSGQRGVTLVELVIAIVIIGIAVSGVLATYGMAVAHSADPMLQQQALAIGEAYLDEILARAPADPDAAETGGAEAGETRADYDDVQDYAGLSELPTSQAGVALAGLEAYAVTVAVHPIAIGPAGDTAPALAVDVTVSRPPEVSLTLTGYRAIY